MYRFFRWLTYLAVFFVLVIVLGYAAAQFYKPTLLQTLNRSLKEGVNGDFHIGGLDFTIFEQFPNVSIAISDISLRGPRYDSYHKNFFHADKIYVHVKLTHLLQGAIDLRSISIKNGDVFIFRTMDGYSNMEVFKKTTPDSVKKGDHAFSLGLDKILLENTRFAFVDSLKGKSVGIAFPRTTVEMRSSDSSRFISLIGKIEFGGLTFNKVKGGYLMNTPSTAALNLEFMPKEKQLIVHPSVLQFPKSTVNLEGRFGFGAPGNFSLLITSPAIDYSEGLTLITRALNEKLSKFHFDAPLKLSVNVIGHLAPGEEPKVDVGFSTAHNVFATNKVKIEELAMSGSFTNHLDSTKLFDDYNSRVELDSVAGTVEGIHTKAKVRISNLKDPDLILRSRSSAHLVDLNHSDTTHLKFLGGEFHAEVQYDGKVKEYMDSSRTSYNGKLHGSIQVEDGAVSITSKERKIEGITLKIHFTEKQMDISKVDFIMNGNKVNLTGQLNGFIPFFFVPEKKGFVRLSLYSPKLDLATLVKKKSGTVRKKSLQGRRPISNFIDVLDKKVEFIVNVKVDELVNGPFRASELTGKISLVNNQFSADPVTMKMANGNIRLGLKMANLNEEINPIELSADVKNADIEKFFSSFNNFSQPTLTSKNIKGKISTSVRLKANVDDNFNVLMPSLRGAVDLSIKNGKLSDFEPLQKMSNFLFKKRDFDQVEFAEIRSRFELHGPSLDISRMEIQSSVLTLFVQGRYALADSTDLSIQVPLSNLKRRDKTYKPENEGVDAKVGPSVYLRAHYGKDGKFVISYDPFGKFKRKS